MTQNRNDHLEPVEGVFSIYNYQFEYYYKIRKILFDGLTEHPEIRFQVLPSFTPEAVLDIEFDKRNKKYYMVYHICEGMIWYNEQWENTKVEKFKTGIDKESVDLIKSLFDTAVMQVKFSEKGTHGLDGTDYYFSVNKYGLESGTVWSPSAGTRMNKLVNLGYKLIELAKSEKEIVKIDEELQKEMEELIDELK